jgi:hypothetical protein
LTFLLI